MEVQVVGADEKVLSKSDQQIWLKQLDGWEIKEEGQACLYKAFHFNGFKRALEFVNQIGELAEVKNHHPELTLSWGKVEARWWTHTVDGLHINDFILAARTDSFYVSSDQ